MRKSWLLCVLLGAMAWGQAPSGSAPSPSPAQTPNSAAPASTPPAAEVSENAVVLTVFGVCPSTSTTAASKSVAGSKTATAAAKPAAAKKPADCKIEITRKEFEKIASGLAPTVTPQLKRQLAAALPKFMAMSEAAKAKGLDKTPQYEETLKVVKMQILTQQLQRSVQEEAEKVSPEDIETYYKKYPEAYEQFSLDRLFVPRFKQAEVAEKNNEEKLTEEQQKGKEATDKAKQEAGEQELTKLAESLRARAAAGEDFARLQKEAFEAAGMKMDSPTVTMPKVRRTGLPPAHAAVFDLKVGEISAVITDNGGHYIYKVESKEVVPLDQVKDEIRNTLKNQKMKDTMEAYTNSYHAETNEAYFGPAGPSTQMGRPMPPRMRPNTPPSGSQPQPQAAPPAQPPAQQAPPSNPN
ncbi:MAG: peptidylprolyl isomerase [Candidatus Sulfotelmatobacter sp.]|jgi:parvulin-like peptidyl-prolyl cis-trans isomerase-like protein